MEEDFDYTQIPQNYIYCLHAGCPRSADCLRFQAGKHAASGTAIISVINPSVIAGKENNCRHFQPNEKACFAFGITHLFDHIPHKKAVTIKRILFDHFNRSKYYRIRNKTRMIKPQEQEFIRKVFQNEGVLEEPIFDEFIYKYDWQSD